MQGAIVCATGCQAQRARIDAEKRAIAASQRALRPQVRQARQRGDWDGYGKMHADLCNLRLRQRRLCQEAREACE
jgi:hypothetical protein